MKKVFLSLLIALSLFLSACGPDPAIDAESCISVYRLVKAEYRTDGELIRAETMSAEAGSNAVLGAAYALKSVPDSSELVSALPQNVSISSAVLTGRIADVCVSDSYEELEGADKTIADSCITLTMCSIPGVDYVSIHTKDEPMGTLLSTEDFILKNTLISTEDAEIRLYFARGDDNLLAFEYRSVTLSGEVTPERSVIDELLKGPQSEGLRPALPPDTVVPSVYTQEGVCTVSFSSGFLSGIKEDAEAVRLAVYSVVNSLTCLASVDSVQINVQNDGSHMLGTLDISQPLTRRTSLIGSAILD